VIVRNSGPSNLINSLGGTGIMSSKTGRSRILAFDADNRSKHQATIRATAMVFEDPASRALQSELDRLAPSDATILINGETGTGKELVARYIHARSKRADGPFVAVNCGALSESLAEADLFGHEKGAFTGALNRQIGWFEAANTGTLLLDEIGDLALPLQVKLLRVLQEREVTRLGSRQSIPVDVRVIAATNVDLEDAIRAKRFREDLYFRLTVANVRLPSLRDRPGDIGPLAQFFLELYRERLGRRDLIFDPKALAELQRHGWSGNIRELENIVHNAVLLALGQRILPQDLRFQRRIEMSATQPAEIESQLRASVASAIVAGEERVYDRAVAAIVRAGYDLADGNQVRAAEMLGISRNTLRTQLSHLGVITQGRRLRNVAGVAREGRLPELRIGYQKFGTAGILRAKGTLDPRVRQLGGRVGWTEFPAGPQMLDAIRRGEIDFGSTGEVPPVFAQANGAPLIYVAYGPPSPHGEAIVVKEQSDIRKIEDLKGKRIGLNRGSNVHYLIVRALQSVGLSIDAVSLVYLGPAESPVSLLDQGVLDAWVIWDPVLTAVQRKHDIRILADGSGLVLNRQFYLAHERYAAENADMIDLLMVELQRAGEEAARQPTAVAHTTYRDLDLDVSALEVALGRLPCGAKPIDDEIIQEQQAIADTMHSLGLIARPVSIRKATRSTLGQHIGWR